MLRTIKGKLTASFSFFIVIITGLIFLHTWYSFKKDEIEEVRTLLRQVDQSIDEINQSERDFFTDETINPLFYETGNSPYLTRSRLAINDVIRILDKLPSYEETGLVSSQEKIQKIGKLFDLYQQQLNELIKLIQQRGFKDYGLVGQMRSRVHELEKRALNYEHSAVLMLRRHEKDFIIRKDMLYAHKLDRVANRLKESICKKAVTREECRELLALIEDYQESFQNLAKLDEEIGFDRSSGKRGQLNKTFFELDHEVKMMIDEILQSNDQINKNIERSSFIVMIIALGLSLISAYYTITALSKPIQKLSSSIHDVVRSNFKTENSVEVIRTKDEIGKLSKDFLFMFDKVREFIEEIESKSDKIAKKQEQILSSLRYAQKVQEAIMPSEEKLKRYLNDHLVIYKPKDYVSGDFYWITQKEDYTFIAVVDCTGHGVPGAFMSMIGTILLYKVVIQQRNFDPSDALTILNQEIKETLQQEEVNGEKNSDGMDLSLIRIENTSESEREVLFAGAKGNLVYNHKNGLHRIKGSNLSIGGKERKKKDKCKFETHTVTLNKQDTIYLMSDGFVDQNNSMRKKFGTTRMNKLLDEIKYLDLSEQKERLLEALDEHQGQEEQRDDITIFAFDV